MDIIPNAKAVAALSHLMALKGRTGKNGEPEKYATFAIKTVYESPVGDPEPGLFVEGILAGEQPDFEGEIFDYKSSKPNFLKWNTTMSALTGGKSVGNLRGQHNPKVAAGKFVDMQYDDDKMCIPCTAKVVDPIEADKVREGVYTSFSIGAHYAKKWRDGKYMRWTADPFEGSIVDFGAMPMTRGFTYRAADGTTEEREFDGGRRELRKAFESLGKTLAVEEEDRVVKAINAMAAAQKGLYTISGFAQLVQQLIYLRDSITFEREQEGDASPVTDRVAEATDELLECLAAYTQEQVSEEIGKKTKTEEKAVDIKDLVKDVKTPPAAKSAADNADVKPTNDEVQKALDGINASLKVLKAAGYTAQPGSDDHGKAAGAKCGKSADDCDDDNCDDHGTENKSKKAKAAEAKAAAAKAEAEMCKKTAEECSDEKCTSHKGKSKAAVGEGDVALKRADVESLINTRMAADFQSFRTSFEKDVVGPLSEQLKAIGETLTAIGNSPMPTRIASRKGITAVGKDDEAIAEQESADKAISDDVSKGNTTSAILKIRARGGNRVGL